MLSNNVFVLKASRYATKHVINEGGGHIWSFLDAIIAESSLETVCFRTLEGGSGVLNLADQKSDKQASKCVEGGEGGRRFKNNS